MSGKNRRMGPFSVITHTPGSAQRTLFVIYQLAQHQLTQLLWSILAFGAGMGLVFSCLYQGIIAPELALFLTFIVVWLTYLDLHVRFLHLSDHLTDHAVADLFEAMRDVAKGKGPLADGIRRALKMSIEAMDEAAKDSGGVSGVMKAFEKKIRDLKGELETDTDATIPKWRK